MHVGIIFIVVQCDLFRIVAIEICLEAALTYIERFSFRPKLQVLCCFIVVQPTWASAGKRETRLRGLQIEDEMEMYSIPNQIGKHEVCAFLRKFEDAVFKRI